MIQNKKSHLMVLKNRPEKDNNHLFVATKSSHNQNNLILLATANRQV